MEWHLNMRGAVLLVASLWSPLFFQPVWAGDPAQDARWRADLQYLASQLPSRHPNLFFSVSRADFNRAVAELARISHSP